MHLFLASNCALGIPYNLLGFCTILILLFSKKSEYCVFFLITKKFDSFVLSCANCVDLGKISEKDFMVFNEIC